MLTVGLPLSGKSTWARRQLNAAIVNPDSIRLALHGQRFLAEAELWVWAMAYSMASALFLAGHQLVIVDATNVSDKRRREWVARFQHPPVSEVCLELFPTSPAECARRALARGDEAILPVIDRMAREWDLGWPADWGERPPG